jgi:hypothetical protein
MALCPLYDLIYLYGPTSPLRPFIPATALCLLYGPLHPLPGYVPSVVLRRFYGPMSYNRPLSSLQPSVLSTAL